MNKLKINKTTSILTLNNKQYLPYQIHQLPKNYNDTFAEMSLTKKNSISHRQIAIKKLRKYLLSLE